MIAAVTCKDNISIRVISTNYTKMYRPGVFSLKQHGLIASWRHAIEQVYMSIVYKAYVSYQAK